MFTCELNKFFVLPRNCLAYSKNTASTNLQSPLSPRATFNWAIGGAQHFPRLFRYVQGAFVKYKKYSCKSSAVIYDFVCLHHNCSSTALASTASATITTAAVVAVLYSTTLQFSSRFIIRLFYVSLSMPLTLFYNEMFLHLICLPSCCCYKTFLKQKLVQGDLKFIHFRFCLCRCCCYSFCHFVSDAFKLNIDDDDEAGSKWHSWKSSTTCYAASTPKYARLIIINISRRAHVSSLASASSVSVAAP